MGRGVAAPCVRHRRRPGDRTSSRSSRGRLDGPLVATLPNASGSACDHPTERWLWARIAVRAFRVYAEPTGEACDLLRRITGYWAPLAEVAKQHAGGARHRQHRVRGFCRARGGADAVLWVRARRSRDPRPRPARLARGRGRAAAPVPTPRAMRSTRPRGGGAEGAPVRGGPRRPRPRPGRPRRASGGIRRRRGSTGSSPATPSTVSKATSIPAARSARSACSPPRVSRASSTRSASAAHPARPTRPSVSVLWNNTASKLIFRTTDAATAERVAELLPRAPGRLGLPPPGPPPQHARPRRVRRRARRRAGVARAAATRRARSRCQGTRHLRASHIAPAPTTSASPRTRRRCPERRQRPQPKEMTMTTRPTDPPARLGRCPCGAEVHGDGFRDCVFRWKPNTHSSPNRSLIPFQADHPFQSMPITDSSSMPITFGMATGMVRGV